MTAARDFRRSGPAVPLQVQYVRQVRVEAQTAYALDPNEDYAYHILGRWHNELVRPRLRLRRSHSSEMVLNCSQSFNICASPDCKRTT